MKKLSVGPGMLPVVLVLLRKLFPNDAFVTHFNKAEGKWYADLVMTGQRWSGASRRELFDKFSNQVLNTQKQKRGRPFKGTKAYQFNLTPQVKTYLDSMAQQLGVEKSTFLSYLLCKAHQAMQEALTDSPEEEDLEFEDLTDDKALMESMRQLAFKDEPKPRTQKSVLNELKKVHGEELDSIARKIRSQMAEEEIAKGPKVVPVNALNDLKERERVAEEKLRLKHEKQE